MSKQIDKECKKMLDMAYEAMEHSYSPYSNFKVGACLKTADGKYYTGSNIENSAYSVTNCAERTAIFTAVHAGEREFDAIAVVCSNHGPAYPCGACRQVMTEFCSKDFAVILDDGNGKYVQYRLDEVLPYSFTKEDLFR